MTTYHAAHKEVTDLLAAVMKEYHWELSGEGVRVGVIMATSDGESPAVKHSGYPAAGKISVVSLKDRVEKQYEAELIIDSQWWSSSRKEHHRALLDHELSHLELVEDEEEGGYKHDDLGRPKLKIKLGDWNGGDGFAAVVERHGDFACEVANFRKVEAKMSEVKRRLFPIDTPPKEEEHEDDTVLAGKEDEAA